MLQDRMGFIWFGTLNGLNRFDGIRIKTIIPETRNPNSLTSGKIKDLYEDSHGHIWVRTYSDIFHCYNPLTESFWPIFRKKNDLFVKHNYFYQDLDGNVWLGSTSDGCVRYRFVNNNFEIQVYETNNGAFSIPSNRVNDILQDSRKNTWILTSEGISLLNNKGETRQVLNEVGKKSFLKAFEQHNKVYFVTSYGAVYYYHLDQQRFGKPIHVQITQIIQSTPLGNNFLMFASSNEGVTLLDTRNHQVSRLDQVTTERIRGNIIFTHDGTGSVWLNNKSGKVWRIQPNMEITSLNLIPSNIIPLIDEERFQFKPDKLGNIWITTYGNGLFRYHEKTGHLSHFKADRFSQDIGSNYLLSILIDKNDHIWIGTENMGVNKFSFIAGNIQHIKPDQDSFDKNGNVVRSLFEDSSGKIWVATKAGNLYTYDASFRTRTKVLSNSYKVYSIYEDKDQTVWLGTRGNGIIGLPNGSMENSIMYRHTDRSGSLSDNNVFGIMKDNRGRLWAATFGGGISVKVNPLGNEGFRTFFDDDDWIRFARHIMMDSNGSIWVATSNGVLRFNPDSLLNNRKAYRHYAFNSKIETSLSNPEVRYIFEDSEGRIWLATSGGGLNLFIGETPNGQGQFKAFKNKQGIAFDNIMGILEDNAKNLWIGTEAGIQKFNPKTEIFQFYRFSNDFSANIFSEATNVKCRDGRMIWGSLNGFFVFDPQEVDRQSNQNTPVLFTGFAIYNNAAKIGPNAPLYVSAPFATKVVLRHSDQVFHIEFSTLDFIDPKSNQFMYILENYEKRWNTSTDGFHTATYRNVPPGRYTFKVKSINNDGTWDNQVSSLYIYIRPPFWKSTTAFIVYFILLSICIYIGIRIALNFYRLDNAVRVERQLTDYKLRFFTNISHEFRTPLTLIKGSIDTLISLKDKFPESIQKLVIDIDKNSNHLMRLIEQLLEFRKLQNNKQKLNLQRVEAIGFIRNIFSSFENVAAKTNIDYQCITPDNPIPIYFDQNKVDKIIFNLLSNAFKFTPRGGKITVSIEVDDKSQVLLVSVSDTGIGIPKEKQHLLFSRFMQINFSQQGTGIGLHLVSEFIALHQGKVTCRENVPAGSVFTVSFPLLSTVYQPDDFVVEQITVENDNKQEVYHLSDYVREKENDVLIDLVPIVPMVGKKYTLLVIDDNDDIREFLEQKLNQHFHIITAADGDSGMQKSIDEDPDLIICDVMMPGMNGFELTRKLKDEFETCHIPVILLTAYLSDEHEAEGVVAGADAYITKPFSLKYLMLQINKLLEKKEKLQKHYAAGNIPDKVNTRPTNDLSTTPDISFVPEKDSFFLQQAEQALQNNISNPHFTVDDFAQQLNTGRTLFFKKLKSLTGFSPNEFIRIRRMQKAAELLKTYKYNVSEVSYMVGINDPFYFSKCFKAQFGCSPSKYLNS